MDLNTRIQWELGDGKTPDQIVAELVESGMTEPTARRLVERAAAKPLQAPTFQTAHPPERDPSGSNALIRGTLALSAGATITVVTFMLAKPGETYVVTWGMVAGGLIMFGRGLYKWSQGDDDIPFPVAWVVGAAVLPVLFGVGTVAWARHQEGAPRGEVVENAAQAARKAEETRRETVQKFETRLDAIQKGRQAVISPDPSARCEGARIFAAQHYLEGTTELGRLANSDPEVSVRECAVDALVALDQLTTLVPILKEQAHYDGLRDVAAHGFATMGPTAALPVLREWLNSPETVVRSTAIEALANMGPAAAPLLQEATSDADVDNRLRAARALAEVKKPQ